MIISDYIVIGQSARDLLESHILKIVEDWHNNWFTGNRSVTLSSDVLDNAERARLSSLAQVIIGYDEGNWCALSVNGKTYDQFASALIGWATSDNSESIAIPSQSVINKVVDKVLKELADNVCNQSPGFDANSSSIDMDTIESHEAGNGSGAQILKARIGELELNITLSGGLVQSYVRDAHLSMTKEAIGEGVKLGTFSSALATRRITAEAVLGSVELSISALASLRVGDVIRLDKSLTEPSTMLFPGCDVRCSGFLGQCGGNRALSLLGK